MPPMLPSAMDIVLVYFPSSNDTVRAEFATTPAEIQRGLMHRTNVPSGTGMLFDMGRTAVHGIWMKNTLVPLDLVFIDADRVVVGIAPHAVPGDLTARGVAAQSRFVLEVPAGWCDRHRLVRGQRATIVMVPQ